MTPAEQATADEALHFARAHKKRIAKRLDHYFAARDVVNRLKLEFASDVHVDLLLKHIDNSGRLYKAGVDRIDYHIPERYTRADLEAKLGMPSGAHP
ncbi:hypothetical protein [Pseudomonas protegens]|uniref:hypothetical protein n=1 Tax=Pseudomonas protegens TaxID=380021 RepID=UPI0031F5CC37